MNVGRIKLYLLDTDNDMNSEFDRPITHSLYGGDWVNRLKQEILLGIGGILTLKKLGIKKGLSLPTRSRVMKPNIPSGNRNTLPPQSYNG
jgi:glucan phosphorylase